MVKRKAFTLVEMMVTVAIIGILFTVGPPIFLNLQRFFLQNSARGEIQAEIRVMMDNMDRTIRQASANSINVSQDSGQPPYSKIKFTTVDGRTVIYKQSGRRLLEIVNGNTKTLSKNIYYLAFTYPKTDTNTVISISITLQKGTFERRTTAIQMAITKVRVMNP